MSRRLMGTVFQITAYTRNPAKDRRSMSLALDEMERLEALLSEWQPTSEISRINQRAGNSPVTVSNETMNVVQAGLLVSKRSQGAFDITWAALHGVYRFTKGNFRRPSPGELQRLLPNIDYQQVRINPSANTVFLGKAKMALGTGGIAKGYALDRAAALLKKRGLGNFMLFGGGQVQLSGRRADRPWRVGVQHPRQPSYFGFLELESGSIATSGDYEHTFVEPDGTRWHHILDVKTGLPARGTLSATVVAQQGILADALSTACFVLGSAKCIPLVKEFDADALVVGEDMTWAATPALKERFTQTGSL